MTKQETINFLQRIKSYYQEFSIDEFKINEWYKRLKNYDYQDVNDNFEKHLNSEEFGRQIPKLNFLTRYLKTEEEKKKPQQDLRINCNLCHRPMLMSRYDEHYSKCLSITYLLRILRKKGFDDMTYDKLDELSEEHFKKIYERYKEW